ncbi:MAG: hypothetical protein V1796_05875, partial [Pseudomonadota bacterium]
MHEQNRIPNVLAQAGGALAAAFGFLVLLGWVLELPLLTVLELRWTPMAPSSALLFLLFGAALFASARAPINRPVQRAVTVIGTAVTLVALLLFFLSWQGIQPDAEHFGVAMVESIRGASIGHMSQLSALGFVLAGLSFLASLGAAPDPPWRTAAGFFFSGLLVCTAVVLLLGHFFRASLFYGGTFIPPALTSSLTFAALGVGLLALAARRTGVSAGREDVASRRASRNLVFVFALVAAGLVGAGFVYSLHHEKLQREVIGRQLSAVTDLKVAQLAQWRAERLANAIFLSRSAAFAELVRHAFANPQDRQAQERVHGWLRDLHQSYAYDRVDLFDAQGVARLSLPAQ